MIITDTHLRPEGGDTYSPWRVNLLANDRARWVVDRINLAFYTEHKTDIYGLPAVLIPFLHPYPRPVSGMNFS